MLRFVFHTFIILLTLVGTSHALDAQNLRVGDLVFISLPCRICQLIEREQGQPFSHLGMVIEVKNNTPTIAHSLHGVERISLTNFLRLATPNKTVKVFRPRFSLNRKKLLRTFETKFLGLNYDSAFLWDNFDEKGQKIYCSELIAKLYNSLRENIIPTKPMHFNADRAVWIKYFKGNPPDGLPGVTPAAFIESNQFFEL